MVRTGTGASIDVIDNEVFITLNGVRKLIPVSGKYTAKRVMYEVCDMAANHRYKEDIVAYYKEAGDMLGVSVSKFAKMLNGAIHRVYIKPNYAYIKRFAYINGYLNYDAARLVIRDKTLIDQYLVDNNEHLAAFALIFGDTRAAKKVCGKGLWKSLSNNAKTRNDRICQQLLLGIDVNAKSHVLGLQTLPSSLLHLSPILRLSEHLDNSITKFIAYLGRPLYKIKIEDVNDVYTLLFDCKRMLGDNYNPKWSINRVKCEHDKEYKRIQALKYTAEEFPYCDTLPATIPGVVFGRAFTATLVRSPLDLNTLGMEEGHCIGSYHQQCWNGDYIVYTIVEDSTGILSSFGIYKYGDSHTSQHYHKYNKIVVDEARIRFVHTVVDVLKKRGLLDADKPEQDDESVQVFDVYPF